MGDPTGFLTHQREDAGYRPIEERIKDFKEVIKTLPPDKLQIQAARCMDCGIPFCHAMGCPVYNLIPEFNDLVYNGQWKEAYERLELTNNLPEITGRICPAPCEAACTLSINSSPVTIKMIELVIIERAFEEGWVVPRIPDTESGKHAAVIGSGPAGLAAAQQLRRMGHQVTLFEKDPKIGGLLRYGIPDFKLDKAVIDRRLEQMKAEGVMFETNVKVGDDLSANYLSNKFDAVLITAGAGQPRDLDVPGRDLEGVYFAMDYLSRANKYVDGQIEREQIIDTRGKNVLVIGGGDTGSDCVGTSNRLDAKKVYQYEIMPKPLEWSEPTNPDWPYWPRILRNSSSHKEGCERDWNINTVGFEGSGERLEKVNFKRVEWEKDENGRFQMKEIPGSEFSLAIDYVFLAMGFVHTEHGRLLKDFDLKLTRRGDIESPKPYYTSREGVFTAGDANIGASLVVRAISHGRLAAEAVDSWLSEG